MRSASILMLIMLLNASAMGQQTAGDWLDKDLISKVGESMMRQSKLLIRLLSLIRWM